MDAKVYHLYKDNLPELESLITTRLNYDYFNTKQKRDIEWNLNYNKWL